MTTTLSRTPLYNISVEFNGRMVPFAGWEMAVQFTGISREHEAVRQAVGMFDISHMGKFILRGERLIDALQALVPSDLSRLQPGEAQYSVLLNVQGKILDDIIFYDQGIDPVTNLPQGLMIVNAATKSRDKAWISAHIEDQGVTLEDLSRDQVLLAVQGPQAEALLQPLVNDDLSNVKFFGHINTTILGKPAFIARTGYTGEDGFEIMVDPDIGIELWQNLAAAGVIPCGLGARDTLRLEAGLGWVIHWETKGKFIGRRALEQQKANGVTQKLVGLEMQGRHIARHGYPVLSNGERVGEITSGTLSPTLGKPISMAYVPTELSKIGQFLDIEIRGKTYPATVVKRPFYRSPHRPKK